MRPAALVLVLAVLLAGFGHITSRPSRGPVAAAPRPAPPVVIGGDPVPASDQPEVERDAPFTSRTSAGARRAARRFVDAYTRWETGDDSDDTQRALRASTSPQLQALLATGRGQPAAPADVSRAKLTSLIAGTVSPDEAATVVAQLERGDQKTGLAMIVKRNAGRWRVTSIGR